MLDKGEPCSVVPRPQTSFFFCNGSATTEIYTLSLHDALPICVIDITELFGGIPGNEPCISSFLMETRSSQTPDAVLKDFIGGGFNTCGEIIVNEVFENS